MWCSRVSALMVIETPELFLCRPRPPSHHPSILTSVSLVPCLHLLRPSSPFWPYGTHPFFPHSQTISILSDPLYSLTQFLFQLSYIQIKISLKNLKTYKEKLILLYIYNNSIRKSLMMVIVSTIVWSFCSYCLKIEYQYLV